MRRARYVLLAALALAVLAGAPAAVAGKPVGIAESFPTRCGVDSVSVAPGGGAWFACSQSVLTRRDFYLRAKAGRITPTGKVTEFQGPFPKASEPGRTPGVTAADGSFWFPVEAELNSLKAPVPPSLARVTPSGEVALFPVTGGRVAELVAVPDGTLRMKTEEDLQGKSAAVWQVSPSGEITKTEADPALPLDDTASFPQKPVAPPEALLSGGTIGADGNLWYGILSGGGKSAIGRITPTGETTEFRRCLRYGQPYFGPETLVRGTEGNIWFTSLAERSLPNITDPASIGMVTPAGEITQIYAGVGVEPRTIAAAPEGGVWFAGGLVEIQRIKPPQGVVNTFHIGKLSGVRRGGSALLKVKVPGPGTIQAKPVAIVTETDQKTKRTAIRGAAGATATTACGSPQVRIHLTGEALQRLQASGNVRVAVSVTFSPRGGHPYSEEATVQFRLPRRR